ncbi:hypothetical protein K503DRAFT_767484 [Rhizopogon vinicolor AM-OR11-026]|uniref:Granulins domain-containing protein n=1 Tax=Rhizopogon vinicolor AM-OR11-026 TaxID=1314800 RepID=A0A1B7N9Z3_9AGAM|nr:hypothetical protein K503DRAFT_767484 [Rhizopogon vinicolor AM-OR11-026]
MRFSFLVTITALTASMSVSACSELGDPCSANVDCCDYPISGLYCPTGTVCIYATDPPDRLTHLAA